MKLLLFHTPSSILYFWKLYSVSLVKAGTEELAPRVESLTSEKNIRTKLDANQLNEKSEPLRPQNVALLAFSMFICTVENRYLLKKVIFVLSTQEQKCNFKYNSEFRLLLHYVLVDCKFKALHMKTNYSSFPRVVELHKKN